MAFDYGNTGTGIYSQPGKCVQAKSFKIDIAAGSGFTTATEYTLGYIPAVAQVIGGQISVATAVSGGTVSAATLQVKVAGNNVFSGSNVFAAGNLQPTSGQYAGTWTSLPSTTDQKISYTPSLTGAGATAGVMYVTLYYVA